MRPLRALALDVDGTLTDGGVFWGPDGQEWKRFCFADIMGVARAMRAGVAVTLISGEDSPLVDRFAAKMGIALYSKGVRDKAAALRAFASSFGCAVEEIGFMGDDINDLPAMAIAGYSAAPADAQPAVRARGDLGAEARAGFGAVGGMIEAVRLAHEQMAAVSARG